MKLAVWEKPVGMVGVQRRLSCNGTQESARFLKLKSVNANNNELYGGVDSCTLGSSWFRDAGRKKHHCAQA
eukprot:2172997-Alexandrium_andersonii.AAC.1